MANNYYSLRAFFRYVFTFSPNERSSSGSYDHFCFFNHISNSTKTSDDFAFFVFFTFKSGYPMFHGLAVQLRGHL